MKKNELDILRSPNLIVLSNQSYSSLQKDIFTLAISQLEVGIDVNKDLFQNTTVCVPIKMLTQMSEKNYKRLKSECEKMSEKRIVISDDAKQKFEIITVFPRIVYNKNIIELTMFADVAERFMELKKGYSAYYIQESLSLNTYNKKRLYEILSIFKNRDYPEWFCLDSDLKLLLGIVDKKGGEDKYKGRHTQFAEKIIGLSINSINEQTSLFISYKREQKEGEWGTRFFIKNKLTISTPKKEPLDEYLSKLDDKQQRLYNKLKDIKVRIDMIKTILENDSFISQSFKWFHDNQDNLKNKKFTNPAAILLVTLGLVEIKAKKTLEKKQN